MHANRLRVNFLTSFSLTSYVEFYKEHLFLTISYLIARAHTWRRHHEVTVFQYWILPVSLLLILDLLVLVFRVVAEPNLKLGALHHVMRVRAPQWFLAWINYQMCMDIAIGFGVISRQMTFMLIFRSNRGRPCEPLNWGRVYRSRDKEAKKPKRTVVTRRSTPLSRSCPVPTHCRSCERSWKLLGQAFDVGMYSFKWWCFWCLPMPFPNFCKLF